jgi:hypothetical protein
VSEFENASRLIQTDAAQQPHFDLSHPFSADAELSADSGVGKTRASQLRHLALTFGQRERRSEGRDRGSTEFPIARDQGRTSGL